MNHILAASTPDTCWVSSTLGGRAPAEHDRLFSSRAVVSHLAPSASPRVLHADAARDVSLDVPGAGSREPALSAALPDLAVSSHLKRR